jgi:serpin B
MIAMVLLLSGCTQSSESPPDDEIVLAQSQAQRAPDPNVPDADMHELVAGNSVFAFDLYHQVKAEEENLFFSPYSISTALAMTYAGAREETAKQMADTLHFSLLQEQLHPAFNALDLTVTPNNENTETETEEDFTLNIANSLWGQQDYPFHAEFLDLLAENYGAGLRLLDFVNAPEPARQTINDWVSEQTEDKIKDLIPEGAITIYTRLVLANAIYFNASWLHPFDEAGTQDMPFNLLDGTQTNVPMMTMSEPAHLPYVQGSGYQAVELPYMGERASMIIIMPDAGKFTEFETALDAGQVEAILTNLEYKSVALNLPKFSYEMTLSLKETLEEMGMQNAVDCGLADFSGMAKIPPNLCISDVFHKAFVAVDEAGTEAAAATVVIIGIESVPMVDVNLTADRPFIFLIRDTQTGSILFLGRVLNPVQ